MVEVSNNSSKRKPGKNSRLTKLSKKKESDGRTKWFEEYTSLITGEKTIIGPFMDNLIEEMLNYVHNNNEATIVDFLWGKGIPYSTFEEWVNRYPELAAAFDQFNMSIADTIERKAREKNDIGFSIRSMSYYSKKWRKFDDERQVNKTGDTGPQTIVVEIPAIKNNE